MKQAPDSRLLSCSPRNYVSNDYNDFRKRLFISILIVASAFALLFGIMHDAGLNQIGNLHARINYAYAVTGVVILLVLHKNSDCFQSMIVLFLIASHLTFTSALINVPDDQFRAIWFYLLVLVAYMLDGSQTGLLTTAAAIVTIFTAGILSQLHLTPVTMTSILLGLVILGLIAHVFTSRATLYARLVEEKNRQLEKLAKEDPLTGIMNARSYYEIGLQLFKLAKREKTALTMLYLDIDHFKKINDTYGHHCGDTVLISITNTILSVLRESDLLARIGGEEFSILLPDTDIEGGRVLAEKIREKIEKTAVSLEKDSVHITTSIGVTSLRIEDPDISSIQMRADKNLYSAKHSGRNKVISD